MNNKIRKLLIFLVLIIFISLAIIIYFRYTKASKINDTAPTNNYYNAEFLFNNNYIKKSNTIEDLQKSDKTLNIYTKSNTLYINHNKEIRIINNLPTEKGVIYYNDLGNNCYEIADLIKNDLYYANTCLNNKNISFEKISSVAKNIYSPTIYKSGMHVASGVLNSNFIVDTTIGNLKYISSKDNVLGLYNDIDKTIPYFDYICADSNISTCKHLMFYVTFKNELVFKNNKDNPLKDENGKSIIVQDLFGTFSIESHKNIKIGNINYNKLKDYNYLFRVYVLSKDNKLYFVDIDKNSGQSLILKQFSSKKIKSINYDSSDENVKKVLITYEDGKFATINSSLNNKIVLSTIYDRTSITNVK